jgi:CrcB protein
MTEGTPAAAPGPSVLVGVLATGVGGAAGALARWSLTSAFPIEPDRFPWTTFVINVVGAGLLAALPLLAAVHRRPWLAVLLGTGVLGGFTTMSAASAETFALLDHGHVVLGLAYCLGTLAAALVVVLACERLTTVDQRSDVETHDGDL